MLLISDKMNQIKFLMIQCTCIPSYWLLFRASIYNIDWNIISFLLQPKQHVVLIQSVIDYSIKSALLNNILFHFFLIFLQNVNFPPFGRFLFALFFFLSFVVLLAF